MRQVVTMSGRNDDIVPRTVYLKNGNAPDVQIGVVSLCVRGWMATGHDGSIHGDTYISDWAAAQALANFYGRDKV